MIDHDTIEEWVKRAAVKSGNPELFFDVLLDVVSDLEDEVLDGTIEWEAPTC